MKFAVKAGKLSNGAERDKGHVIHAIPCEGVPYLQKALCGAAPRIQWSERENVESKDICPKCLKRMVF